jgi:hypothetical protein
MLFKANAILKLIGLRIPFLLLCGPRAVALDEERAVVRIPLNLLNKNHFINGMYFGVLCAGADLAAGLPAARLIFGKYRAMRLVFADLKVEFLKRADGDVVFTNLDVRAATEAVERAAASGERVNVPVRVVATVPSRYGDEPVATFTLTMSVKLKGAEERQPAARAATGTDGRADSALH